jgi:hypothetical protein
MQERTPQALAAAVQHLLANYPLQADTRRYAEGYNWDDTTRGQLMLFERILRGANSMRARGEERTQS